MIITVPTITLVNQWVDEAKKFNFTDSKKRAKLAKYLAKATDNKIHFSIYLLQL